MTTTSGPDPFDRLSLKLFAGLTRRIAECANDALVAKRREEYELGRLREDFLDLSRSGVTVRLRSGWSKTLFVRMYPGDKWELVMRLDDSYPETDIIEGTLIAFESGRGHRGITQEEVDGFAFIVRDAKFEYFAPQPHWTPVALKYGDEAVYGANEPPFGSIDYAKAVQAWMEYIEQDRLPISPHATVDP